MTDVFRSWAGWECIPLPADGAEVLSLNGMPPEGTVSFSQRPDLLEVLFCHSGEAKLDVSGGRHLLLRSGQVLFFPAGQAHAAVSSRRSLFKGCWFRKPSRRHLPRCLSFGPAGIVPLWISTMDAL